MNSEVLILTAEAISVYFLVLWAHSLRHRFGLAHFYALIGGITAVMSWVTDAGVSVRVAGITFMVGSTVFYTSLLLGVFVVYVFDGVRATRIAISTVAGVSVMVPLIAVVLHLQMTISGHAPLGYVPIPSLRINAASVFATVADLIFLAMAWEFLGKPGLGVRLWLRAFATLLGVMWLDVILFATGAFAGTPEYLEIMKGTLLSRLIISAFACPFLYLYMNRQNRKMGLVIESRPVLAIIKEIAEVRKELSVAQREIELRKCREEALWENQRLSAKAEIIGKFGYWDRDFKTNTGAWSRGVYRIFGIDPEKFQGSYEFFLNLVHPLDRERVGKVIEDALNQGRSLDMEFRIIRPDGKERMVHVVGEARFDENGRASGLFGTTHDITERRRMEDNLAAERERLTSILDGIAVPTFVIDRNRKVVLWNRFNEAYTGMPKESLLGKPVDLSFLLQGKALPSLAELILTMGDEELLARFARSGVRKSEIIPNAFESTGKIWIDGAERLLMVQAARIVDSRGDVVGVVQTAQDITESRQLEARLLQSQKMEAIGTLAGGIAHDFNNILGIIMGNAELMEMKVPEDSPARRNLDVILKSIYRARDVVKQILTFSRMGEEEWKPLQMAPIFKQALKLFRATLPASIEVRQEINLAPGDDLIMGDATQVHQVLMNLVTNAAYAMRLKGGILGVSLRTVDTASSEIPETLGLSSGKYLQFTVEDTGHGMNPAVLDRIFEPYFTTKGPGEGTGLGLAVVHGIVEKLGGAIKVRTEKGKGSAFHVFLPRLESGGSPEAEETAAIPRGNERILWVDDEEDLANVGKQILDRLGYRVTATTDSVDALELFIRHPDRFDLVVTDYTMPGMTGVDLAREMITVRRDIPIILVTGYNEAVSEEQAVEAGIRAFLMKPIASKEIGMTIRSVLDREQNQISKKY